MPFQRRRKLHISLVWASLADNMGQGKNPTVQSQTDAPDEGDLWTAWQLFPLDYDQTCHSKDNGSAYSDGQLWEEIEWELTYYITQFTGNSMRVGRSERWRYDAVEKTAPSREAGPSGPPLSNPGEQERKADGHKSGGQYVAVLFSLQLPFTHNPFNKVRGIFFKRTVSLVIVSLWFCIHLQMCMHMYYCVEYTTITLDSLIFVRITFTLLVRDTNEKSIAWTERDWIIRRYEKSLFWSERISYRAKCVC